MPSFPKMFWLEVSYTSILLDNLIYGFCRFGFRSKNDCYVRCPGILWYYNLTFIFKIVQPKFKSFSPLRPSRTSGFETQQ
jgi:hypothetical protein